MTPEQEAPIRYKERESLKGKKPIGYRNSDYPLQFEELWSKRKHTDYRSRKEAAYALYLIIEKEISQLKEELKRERETIDSLIKKHEDVGINQYDIYYARQTQQQRKVEL